MHEFLTYCKSQSILNIAFGDIHLQDLRKSHENNLAFHGYECCISIWVMAQDVLINLQKWL